MKKYSVKLKGVSPIIFNVRQEELDEEMNDLKKNELGDWEKSNWRRKAEQDKSGNVIIPIRWIKASFVNACKHSRIVPSFATSKKETYTRYGESIYFEDSSFKCNPKSLILQKKYMGNPNTGGQILKCYPKLDEWETTIELSDPAGRMDISELKTIFEFAGMFEGIGDLRKDNCGRFGVQSIKEIK